MSSTPARFTLGTVITIIAVLAGSLWLGHSFFNPNPAAVDRFRTPSPVPIASFQENFNNANGLASLSNVAVSGGLLVHTGAGGTLANGLLGLWHLNDPLADGALDSSPENNPGNCSGTNCPTATPGQFGQAASFDGVNDRFNVANEADYDFERTNAFTLSAWLKATTPNPYRSVLAKGIVGPAYRGWIFSLDNDDGHQLRLDLINDASANNRLSVEGSTDIVDGAYHHVLATYDGSSTAAGIRLYVDNQLQLGVRT